MNRDDQTTTLMILVILIVGVISLIAISTTVWGIIRDPVRETIAFIEDTFQKQTLDYNFEVEALENETGKEAQKAETIDDKEDGTTNTEADDDAISEENASIELSYDFNFIVPKVEITQEELDQIQELQTYPDAIIEDAQLAGYGYGSDTPQTNLRISIPKIGIDSPVLQGLGADDLLEKGFWAYPGSYTLGEGEVVMLCHRRFFGPYDSRSCWYLDYVDKGDNIYMDYAGVKLAYEVVGTNVFVANDPLIYSISPDVDYIKLVTCTPLYSNSHRLVVLARRVE